jgi:hypothetical protein
MAKDSFPPVWLTSHDDPPRERRHTATARLDGIGWIRPTLAGVLTAMEWMKERGVPQHATIQLGWPEVYAHWSEPLGTSNHD